ncbi:hypothetical protein Tsubulata_035176 [Turnera subulata]|uniref:rRNA N-glycosylase n=1 Tax=Turnera subulata TaxID=218843 RepID=A0A9Q0JR92_9ROSI|nr:hypothetical protein Tsubulata_035176 [Turnera subulata]
MANVADPPVAPAPDLSFTIEDNPIPTTDAEGEVINYWPGFSRFRRDVRQLFGRRFANSGELVLVQVGGHTCYRSHPLHPSADLAPVREFYYIQLTHGNNSIILKVRGRDMYIVGYWSQSLHGFVCFLRGEGLFPGMNPVPLSFGESYTSLIRRADKSRKDIALGCRQMGRAVRTLDSVRPGVAQDNELAIALLTLLIMIPEASRFKRIGGKFLNLPPNGTTRLSTGEDGLITEWEQLSRKVLRHSMGLLEEFGEEMVFQAEQPRIALGSFAHIAREIAILKDSLPLDI